jgi:hypothetical protein
MSVVYAIFGFLMLRVEIFAIYLIGFTAPIDSALFNQNMIDYAYIKLKRQDALENTCS